MIPGAGSSTDPSPLKSSVCVLVATLWNWGMGIPTFTLEDSQPLGRMRAIPGLFCNANVCKAQLYLPWRPCPTDGLGRVVCGGGEDLDNIGAEGVPSTPPPQLLSSLYSGKEALMMQKNGMGPLALLEI